LKVKRQEQLTKRHDVLRSDHEDDRRAWVAWVGFRGEVRGGDDADYEAELLESPACAKRKGDIESAKQKNPG